MEPRIFTFHPATGEICENGKPVGVDVAETAWMSMNVDDCNIAFERLANEFDFDIGAAQKWYAEVDG